MNTEREELLQTIANKEADYLKALHQLEAKDAELAEAHQRIAELATAVVRALDEMSGGKHYDAEEILRVVVRDD